jgi:hypothetical protein
MEHDSRIRAFWGNLKHGAQGKEQMVFKAMA